MRALKLFICLLAIAIGTEAKSSERILSFDSDIRVPEAWRMSDTIPKRAGCVPPELEVRREMGRLATEIQMMEDRAGRRQAVKRLQFLLMQLDAPHSRQMSLLVQEGYYEKIISSLSLASDKNTE
ncbi:MAG: hypothetical protein V3S73_09670 [Gammaproteobacteria bacterium]